MAVHEDGVRAESRGGAQRHGGVHAELAGLVGRRGHHAALVGPAAHHHGLAFERGIEQFFDGHEEGVHVHVEDGLHRRGPDPMVASGADQWPARRRPPPLLLVVMAACLAAAAVRGSSRCAASASAGDRVSNNTAARLSTLIAIFFMMVLLS